MRVWMVNQYAVPPTETGGLRPYTLMRQLKERGHDVTLVASSFNHWTREETRLGEGEDWIVKDEDGVQFVWLRTLAYPGSTIARLFSMLAFAHRVSTCPALKNLDPPDVVIGSNPHLFAAYAAKQLAAGLEVPFVMEVRDIWPQSLVDYGRLNEKHPAIRVMSAIEQDLYDASSSIVTLLPSSVEYYVQKGVSKESVYWLPNGVDIDTLPDVEELPRNEQFTVAFIGIHGIANGLDKVLQAADILRDRPFKFRFVGEGGEKSKLLNMASELKLPNVVFDDAVPKSEVPRILSECDAGLMVLKPAPVFKWGISPNKLFDYFGAGRPVVFSVNSSNNPVSDSQGGVTVEPDNPQSMAEGIVKLSETPREERAAMGLRGRKYVEEHHDFSKLGDTLERAVVDAVDRYGDR